MKAETYPGNWATATGWAPPSSVECPYVGIALGPESTEGLVRVDGVLLQAGRVLALRSRQYRIERVHPAGVFTSVSKLQVLLFEDPSELAGARSARADLLASSARAGVNVPTSAFVEVLRVPFVGRRQCRLFVRGQTNQLATVRVVGAFYSEALGAVHTKLLAEETMELDADDTVAELAMYVGGTNEGEAWSELIVSVGGAGGAAELYFADALAIGEMGA